MIPFPGNCSEPTAIELLKKFNIFRPYCDMINIHTHNCLIIQSTCKISKFITFGISHKLIAGKDSAWRIQIISLTLYGDKPYDIRGLTA